MKLISKVTEIYCIADDFCKEYELELNKKALSLSNPSPNTSKTRNRKGRMSAAEMITILVLSEKVCMFLGNTPNESLLQDFNLCCYFVSIQYSLTLRVLPTSLSLLEKLIHDIYSLFLRWYNIIWLISWLSLLKLRVGNGPLFLQTRERSYDFSEHVSDLSLGFTQQTVRF